jgi:UPF0755 protein
LVCILVLAILAAGFLALLRKRVTTPIDHDASNRVISIPSGLGTRAIIERLHEAGVVENPATLRIYLVLMSRSDRLKAGDYKFPSPISALEAIEMIRRGDVFYERVTISEGSNRFQIAETLSSRIGKATPDQFLRLMNDTSAVARLAPRAKNLEGYLFPDTYNYSTQTTPQEILGKMVRRFEEVFNPAMVTRAAQLGMSVHEVVTLASIIEEEARVDEDRALISSVFANRLRRGMPLAADPTFIYAALLARDYDGNPNEPRHRRRNSPYNTYVYPGLPPGPIASPGRESLEAALYPAQTDFLYFVVRDAEGRHQFSRTVAEHDLAVERYRQLRQSLQSQNGR